MNKDSTGRTSKKAVQFPENNSIAGSPDGDVAFSQADYLLALALSVVVFSIYLLTMARSIPPIDGGELSTSLWTFGIPHPTGYPLFSIVGGLFVRIPFFHEVATRANLFAAICTSLAAGVFYFVFMAGLSTLTRDDTIHRQKLNRSKEEHEPHRLDKSSFRASSVVAVAILAFSSTFWEQSTSVEVYPLQLLLFALVLTTWLLFYSRPENIRAFWAGLALGLGFTNHMTTLLTLPALLMILFIKWRSGKLKWSHIRYMFAGGLIAGTLYLYLPIRASHDPLMNWGDPETLQRFVWHVTGKQFRVWMFSSSDVFQKQLGVFFKSLYPEFGVAFLFVLIGLLFSIFSHRRYMWWAILLLAGDLFYAANYSIHDISSYFLLGYVALSLFAALGVALLSSVLSRRGVPSTAGFALLLVLPAISGFSHFRHVDESHDRYVEEYTRDILTSLPEKSIVISFQWDDFVSASIYYQHVDSVRPDIIVVDKELLRRSWYASEVHRRDSSLFPADDPIYKRYRENLSLFENDEPYDANSIERSYSDFIREIVSGGIKSGRKVFVGPEIEDQYLFGYYKVPYGLLYELKTDTDYVPYNSIDLDGYKAAKEATTDYSSQIVGFYRQMFTARASYEYARRHFNRTLDWIDKALDVDPDFQPALSAREKILLEMKSK